MAKRPTKPPTAKYQLTDLKISKVSLVDEPAVPKAVFVIAKRKDETPQEPVAKSEPTVELASVENPQLTELSKKLDTLTETLQKFLDLQVSKQAEPAKVVEQPKPQPTNSNRLAKHAALLDRLSKRVKSTDTKLQNVTGELPPDEE